MCQDHSSSHHHSHHHGNDVDHHHTPSAEAADFMSAKEKLTIRLEHFVNHNKEHADFYKNLAETAAGIGAEEVALLIAAAADDIQRQNQNLEKALTVLKL